MRSRTILAVTSALLAAAGIGVAACGSSRPPNAELTSVNDEGGTPDSGTKRVSGNGSSGGAALCVDDSDAGFKEPAGPCTCTYWYSGKPNSGLGVTLPCGVTLCSEGKREAAVCSVDGQLTVLPGYGIDNCPEAGVDLASLPPCDAGTTPDATAITDASAAD